MSKISAKRYSCSHCGHQEWQSTNHYGQTYSWFNVNKCPSCGWRRPLEATIWECLEEPPEGEIIPEPWVKATVTVIQ